MPSRRSFLQTAVSVAAVGSLKATPASTRAAGSGQAMPVVAEIFPEHVELVLRRSQRQRDQLTASLKAQDARALSVGMVQMENRCGGEAGKQANLDRMLHAIQLAADRRIQMLAFPEMCLPGYFTRTAGTPAEAVAANHALADRVGDSQHLARLQEAAGKSRMVVAFGFCETDSQRHYNAVGVIDSSGAWLGSRRKNPLSPTPYEAASFAECDPKQRSAVFKTQYATIGVSNCFDGEFPESVRRMRLDGAEVLLWCNAATGNPELGHSSRINASGCYAQSNRMWVVCCNAVGGSCYGTSVIVGPSGEPLVILPTDEEALGTATLNLATTADWETWRTRLEPGLTGASRSVSFIMLDHKIVQRHFKQADPVMLDVIRQAGPVTLKPERDRFKLLVRSIISQQISTAAARTIRQRLEARLKPGGVRPETIACLTVDQLREVGVSRQKASYVLDLAQKCSNGDVRLSRIGRLTDEEVIEELIQVKGIGRWSAQMFLIFSLGRLDVFPHDDLGVRSAIRRMYRFKELPNKDECLKIGERWRPYASIGSWYCWRYLELNKS